MKRRTLITTAPAAAAVANLLPAPEFLHGDQVVFYDRMEGKWFSGIADYEFQGMKSSADSNNRGIFIEVTSGPHKGEIAMAHIDLEQVRKI